jgi:hypothetical protein
MVAGASRMNRIMLHRITLSALMWRLQAFDAPRFEGRATWREDFTKRWLKGESTDRIAAAHHITRKNVNVKRYSLNLPRRLSIPGGEVRWRDQAGATHAHG